MTTNTTVQVDAENFQLRKELEKERQLVRGLLELLKDFAVNRGPTHDLNREAQLLRGAIDLVHSSHEGGNFQN